jgi:hypothetical protein
MPEFLQIATALREQMSATLSRSDVLKPLAWMLLITGALTVALAVYAPAHVFIVYSCAALFLATGLGYLVAYAYCLFKLPDALRSEKYSLNKMAIERGFIGDSVVGVVEEGAPRPVAAITSSRDDGVGR